MEENPQDAIDAKQFIESPSCHRVMGLVVEHYRKMSESSKPEEQELREFCYHQLHAIREFHRQLTILAAGGKLALVRRARANGGDHSAA